jgi:signal transduction histidine kinase
MSPLAEILRTRRESLIRRWLAKCREQLRSERALDEEEVRDSLHFFLDEVIAGLERDGRLPETGAAIAAAHGAQRHILRRDIADVVREYALLFECVAEECGQPLPPSEYVKLVLALNAGAALAVSEYAQLRDLEMRRQAWEHFAFLAHELRNPLQTARLSVTLLGTLPNERGVAVLQRSLGQISELLDRSLVDARLRGLDAGADVHREALDLRQLLTDAIADSAPDAEARGIHTALQASIGTRVDADRRVLRSAVTNLLRNAIKFTRSGGTVVVRGSARAIEIEDECGGLAAGDEKKIFETFRQASSGDRSGFGLGLAIARQAIDAHRGNLTVRNLPGKGCVFVATLADAE